MQPSQQLIGYIKQQEGFVGHPYLDPPHNTAGRYSVGYGHSIKAGESYLMKGLTEPQAAALFLTDLNYYVSQTNLALKRAVTQQQFDALVDLAYNAGPGAMQKVANTWNTTGDSTQTANHLKMYDKVTIGNVHKTDPNLTKRRAHEAGWFQGAVEAISAAVVEKKSPH